MKDALVIVRHRSRGWNHVAAARAQLCAPLTIFLALFTDRRGRNSVAAEAKPTSPLACARMAIMRAMTPTLSNIDIAQAANLRRITDIARERLGIPDEALETYGKYKAKISLEYLASLQDRPDGKLVLVTAISPTPAGEGKTTTSVGLGDALNLLGKKAMICLREPALGPVFGMKGGAAGGGYSQVVPMEDINLHFTGDFAAIALANNLLAALIDNHIHHGNELGFDVRRVDLAARGRRERPRAARDHGRVWAAWAMAIRARMALTSWSPRK